MTATESVAETEATPDVHEHPSDWAYVKIAAILAVITGLEVSTYYVSIGKVLIPSLLVMMALKFWIVITWFMHLRFDGKIFKQLFLGGLFLAGVVFVVTLSTFQFWAS